MSTDSAGGRWVSCAFHSLMGLKELEAQLGTALFHLNAQNTLCVAEFFMSYKSGLSTALTSIKEGSNRSHQCHLATGEKTRDIETSADKF